MSSLVEVVLQEVEKNNAKAVEEVELEIGELTLLGKEQCLFAYQTLSNEGPLKGSKLTIKEKKAEVKCGKCNYQGPIVRSDDMLDHLRLPRFSCPECGDKVEIVSGRDCIITNLRLVVD
jgi:hydrogenase nickel insertion protein HypA